MPLYRSTYTGRAVVADLLPSAQYVVIYGRASHDAVLPLPRFTEEFVALDERRFDSRRARADSGGRRVGDNRGRA